MKIDSFKIIESEFNGKKFYQLAVVINGKDFLIGTIRENIFNGNEYRYINCIHKEKNNK